MRRHILLYLVVILVLSSLAYADYTDPIHVYTFEQDPTVSELIDQEGTIDSSSHEIIARVPGINGNAWQFDGADDDVTFPVSLVNGSTSFAIACWINTTSLSVGDTIFAGGDAVGNTVRIQIRGTPIKYDINTDLGFTNFQAGFLANGNWYMVVLSWDNVTDRFLGWQNDTLLGNTTQVGNYLNTPTGVKIGEHQTAEANNFHGLIDECYVYDHPLDQTDITGLFNGGTGDFYPYAAPPTPAPEAPTIVAPSPIDNSHNNTNVTLNVSHSTVSNDVRYYLYLDTSTPTDETDLYLNNVTRNASEWRSFFNNLTYGTYQ